jgi:hypothetical protein
MGQPPFKPMDMDRQRITGVIDNIIAVMDKAPVSFASPGVLQGISGKSLFYIYASQYRHGDSGCYRRAIAALEVACEMTDAGVAGRFPIMEWCEFGKYLQFLQRKLILPFDITPHLRRLDTLIGDEMQSSIGRRNFDPHIGALAAGFYFLGRPAEDEKTPAWQEHLLQGLQDFFVPDGPAGLGLSSAIGDADQAYLGLSHGIAGLLIFLCELQLKGGDARVCRSLLRKAVDTLLKYRYDYNEVGCWFPDRIDPKVTRTSLYLSYGDVGIGYALFRTARALCDPQLELLAMTILQTCGVRRTRTDTNIRHAGLESGSSGLASVFRKLHAITGIPELPAAADFWTEKTLDQAGTANDQAGFEFVFNQNQPHNNFCLTGGIMGIGISLMCALDPHCEDDSLRYYHYY